MPVCRLNRFIGILDDSGSCVSVNYLSWARTREAVLVYESAAEDTEDTYTQAEYDAATEGMYTQDDIDAAVTEATDGMVSQTELEEAVAEATDGMYTQAEYDAALEGNDDVEVDEETLEIDGLETLGD